MTHLYRAARQLRRDLADEWAETVDSLHDQLTREDNPARRAQLIKALTDAQTQLRRQRRLADRGR